MFGVGCTKCIQSIYGIIIHNVGIARMSFEVRCNFFKNRSFAGSCRTKDNIYTALFTLQTADYRIDGSFLCRIIAIINIIPMVKEYMICGYWRFCFHGIRVICCDE